MLYLTNNHEPIVQLEAFRHEGADIDSQEHRDPAQREEGDGGGDKRRAIVLAQIEVRHV